MLEDDDIVTSFDVSALYTNVPIIEAISYAAEQLYSNSTLAKPACNKETFIKLTRLATTNVLLQTHDGVFRQVDDLAMGTPPSMQLSNV